MGFWLDPVMGVLQLPGNIFPNIFCRPSCRPTLRPTKTISMSTTDHCTLLDSCHNRVGEVWNFCRKHGQGLTTWAAHPYSNLGPPTPLQVWFPLLCAYSVTKYYAMMPNFFIFLVVTRTLEIPLPTGFQISLNERCQWGIVMGHHQ